MRHLLGCVLAVLSCPLLLLRQSSSSSINLDWLRMLRTVQLAHSFDISLAASSSDDAQSVISGSADASLNPWPLPVIAISVSNPPGVALLSEAVQFQYAVALERSLRALLGGERLMAGKGSAVPTTVGLSTSSATESSRRSQPGRIGGKRAGAIPSTTTGSSKIESNLGQSTSVVQPSFFSLAPTPCVLVRPHDHPLLAKTTPTVPQMDGLKSLWFGKGCNGSVWADWLQNSSNESSSRTKTIGSSLFQNRLQLRHRCMSIVLWLIMDLRTVCF